MIDVPARPCGCRIDCYHRGGCPAAPAFGFSGRADAMTAEQTRRVRQLLAERDAQTLHVGDCDGSDAEAADLARAFGTHVVVHPDREDGDRNHDIVDSCVELWAAPPTVQELEHSGSWATIRYAREIGRRLVIIHPGGTTLTENCYSAADAMSTAPPPNACISSGS